MAIDFVPALVKDHRVSGRVRVEHRIVHEIGETQEARHETVEFADVAQRDDQQHARPAGGEVGHPLKRWAVPVFQGGEYLAQRRFGPDTRVAQSPGARGALDPTKPVFLIDPSQGLIGGLVRDIGPGVGRPGFTRFNAIAVPPSRHAFQGQGVSAQLR